MDQETLAAVVPFALFVLLLIASGIWLKPKTMGPRQCTCGNPLPVNEQPRGACNDCRAW